MKCYSSTVKLLLLLHTTTSAIAALDKSSRLRGTTTSNGNINHPPATHDDDQHRRSLQTTTASNAISCPPPGTTTELTSLSTTGGTLTLPTIHTIGQLCTLSKQVTSIDDYDDTTIVPLARSYDNESWSYAAGETPAVMLSSNNNGFNCFIESPTPALPVNLALEADTVASQSSTCYGGYASRAIDGNTDGAWSKASVQHTCTDANPWYMVTLGQSHAIGKVIIHNRSDCCNNRLSNSQVQILDENGGVVTSQAISDTQNVYTFEFGGVVGKSLRIWKTVSGVLNIAEVEIFAEVEIMESSTTTQPTEYCSVDLPPLDVSNNISNNGGEVYVLTTYEHSLSERDQVSRFLSQVSSMCYIGCISFAYICKWIFIYIISKLIK